MLYAAALDPQVMLHEIILVELNNKVWSSLEECVMEYAELVEVAPSSNLCPIFSNLSIEDVHLVCHSYRLLFEDVVKRERLLTQDPLQYWKEQFLISPKSAILRSTILCLFSICATSTPSEQVFSECGQTMTKLRARMIPSMLDQLLVIKGFCNSRYFDLEEIFQLICSSYLLK